MARLYPTSRKLFAATLLLFSFTLQLHAQNWSILGPQTHLLFYRNNNGYNKYAEFIYADSTRISGSDTIFYLNRKVERIDQYTLHANKPFTFQKQLTHFSNGDWEFRDTALWIVRPLEPLNSSWTFAPLRGITATVTRLSLENVLGLPDSVKTITLSNGDSLRTSKDHGLIYIPPSMTGLGVLHLVGHNTSADHAVPRFSSIFDIVPGQILEYESTWTQLYISYNSSTSDIRDSVMSVVTTPTSIDYQVYEWRTDHNIIYEQSTFNVHYDTSTISNTLVADNYGVYNNQVVTYEMNYSLGCKTLKFDPQVTLHDSMATDIYFGPDHLLSQFVYGEGVGLVRHFWSSSITFPTMSNYSTDRVLIGYEKYSQAAGTLYPLSYYLEPIVPPVIRYIANPTENKVTLFAQNPQFPATAQVYDMSGRLVMQQDFVGETTLDIESLSNGIYIFRVVGGTVTQFKIAHYTPN